MAKGCEESRGGWCGRGASGRLPDAQRHNGVMMGYLGDDGGIMVWDRSMTEGDGGTAVGLRAAPSRSGRRDGNRVDGGDCGVDGAAGTAEPGWCNSWTAVDEAAVHTRGWRRDCGGDV